jgi:catechol 2,3-dioxygenase-like lactoylglutathione lyase family enzyme
LPGRLEEIAVVFRARAAFSSFSTDDLAKAKAFYGDKLGLEVVETPMGTLDIVLGVEQHVMIYPKPNHKPATFTVLNFVVPVIEEAVDELTAAGVKMEHYNTPDIKTDAKGIARDERGPAIAWFEDPAGNIISVLELPEDS